ncbi:hypothetical protein HBB16_10895 [Pseudonocardia sp. MCCB 268]|nr:hypothetical protein [Pseudonocardia cytotoxica]
MCQAIAARLGIGDGTLLTGRDLERLDDHELAATVATTSLFRAGDLEHKLRLVRPCRPAASRRGHR